MLARVAKWEGAEADALRRSSEEIRSRAASGPPDGVPASGFLLLVDPDDGRCLAVSLFADEDALRQGDATLNEMNPPGEGLGRRASVETYEVAVDIRS
jgi:hypothetical protein